MKKIIDENLNPNNDNKVQANINKEEGGTT